MFWDFGAGGTGMETKGKRYAWIDTLRGLTLISMIAYHAMWDVVYMLGLNIEWYKSDVGYVWQQSICWTFILLSGFCWQLGKNSIKRGMEVFISGVIITIVMLIAMPENRIFFGILTFLGSAMLIMPFLNKALCRINSRLGALLFFALFLLFRDVNEGTLGFFPYFYCRVPKLMYSNLFTAYLGFAPADFFSADYFGMLPWIFLYITGYYIYRIVDDIHVMDKIRCARLPLIELFGRYSLGIYIAHQPIIYGIICVVD